MDLDLDSIFATGKEKLQQKEQEKKRAKEAKKKETKIQGSADDIFGRADQWKDDGLGGIYNAEGWTNRVMSDNTKIYKAHLIAERDKPNAGNTKDCPFDCDCCFGFSAEGMESFLKSVS